MNSPPKGLRSSKQTSTTRASLRKAFDGAYGAYVVTNFWAQRTPEQEKERTRAEMELDQAHTPTTCSDD